MSSDVAGAPSIAAELLSDELPRRYAHVVGVSRRGLDALAVLHDEATSVLVFASERAEIRPAISAYDLRHTAITHQVERRIPVHKIADWAGTSERMIWEHYRDKLDEVSEIGPVDSDS